MTPGPQGDGVDGLALSALGDPVSSSVALPCSTSQGRRSGEEGGNAASRSGTASPAGGRGLLLEAGMVPRHSQCASCLRLPCLGCAHPLISLREVTPAGLLPTTLPGLLTSPPPCPAQILEAPGMGVQGAALRPEPLPSFPRQSRNKDTWQEEEMVQEVGSKVQRRPVGRPWDRVWGSHGWDPHLPTLSLWCTSSSPQESLTGCSGTCL